MLSLVFSLCIGDAPCKESRVAEFYESGYSTLMCDENKISMSRDLIGLPENARRSSFECKEMPTFVSVKSEPVSELVFEVVTPNAETKTLAKFYGSVGAPLCARNREHYEPTLQKSAASLKATAKVFCKED